jgi:tetratricopeptide (TPR) repeat protein
MVVIRLFLCFILLLSAWPGNLVEAQDISVEDSLKNELLKTKEDTTRIKILEQLFWEQVYSDPSAAKNYLDEAEELLVNVGDSLIHGGIANIRRVYYWSQSDYAASLVAFKQALAVFESVGNKRLISALLNNIGNVYDNLGSYETALDYQIRALKIKEGIGVEPKRIANSYNNIANVHIEMDNYDLAREYYNRMRAIGDSINDESLISASNSNLAMVYGNLGERRKAINLYRENIKYLRKNGLEMDLAYDLDGLGQDYFAIGELDSALICYRESSELNKKVGNDDLLALNYRNIGEALAEKKQYNEALKYLNQGLEISERLETQKEIMHDYRVLSRTYKAMGDYRNALEYHEKYTDKNFELFDEEKIKAINELQIRYDVEKKESEIQRQKERIKILNQEAEIDSLRRKLLLAAVLGILVIAALVVYGLRQKIKRNEAEQEQERAAYEKELYFKRKELTTHTLHLVQKNELLEELREKLNAIRKNSTDSKRELGRVVQIIKNDAVAEKDWENFKLYFQQVHQDFDQKLREQFNDLTANEMRLAALMKMNLTTKEMANILNISPDSVNKARYRLRKKLRLSSDDSLSDFILAL